MDVKIKKLSRHAEMPTYGTNGSACMDVYAVESYTFNPDEKRMVRSGLAVEIPEGYYLEMFNRSSMAGKQELIIISSRVVDADYRGEIMCPMKNIGDKVVVINVGQRFAQMMVKKYEKMDLIEVEHLTPTDRGAGGFGSTGK